MASVTETYISPITGITYELKAFSTQLLYSPQEKRTIKQNNDAFYAAKQSDKLAQQRQAVEDAKPRKLSEQELYEQALEREAAKKAEQAAYEVREAAKVKAHADYLKSDVELAEVATTNFYTFVMECHNWLSRNYTMIDSSLYSTPSGFNSCQFVAPVASKKK